MTLFFDVYRGVEKKYLDRPITCSLQCDSGLRNIGLLLHIYIIPKHMGTKTDLMLPKRRHENYRVSET